MLRGRVITFFFSDAYHKAKIDFTEAGIKAAAVTVFGAIDTGFAEEKNRLLLLTLTTLFYILLEIVLLGKFCLWERFIDQTHGQMMKLVIEIKNIIFSFV